MRDKVIIAFVGKKRSGKDTAGKYIEDMYGYAPSRKLAAPIKAIGGLLFGWTHDMLEGINYDREQHIPELGLSVRQFLQECGSLFKYNLSEIIPEYGEKVGPKVWALACANWLQNQTYDKFYLSDVRFPEEVDVLKEQFDLVYVIKLVSDRSPNDTHISETSVDLITADYEIENNGYDSYEDLYSKLDSIMEEIEELVYEAKYHRRRDDA